MNKPVPIITDKYQWTIVPQTYGPDVSEANVDPRCAGFIAMNIGDTLVTVNGFPLKPFPPGHPELTGASISIIGERGEFYKGRIYWQFDPAGGNAPVVLIAQKIYIDGVW